MTLMRGMRTSGTRSTDRTTWHLGETGTELVCRLYPRQIIGAPAETGLVPGPRDWAVHGLYLSQLLEQQCQSPLHLILRLRE